MPGLAGYEVAAQLKQDKRLGEIPIIFLSALDETADKVRAFAAGGVNYVAKPFQFDEVEARIATHLKIRRRQVELGQSTSDK
jgi:DNA-binding response OmpR family regulator